MKKLRVLDLFSGIGGFSLGLERTGGFETVAFCEIEDYPRRVLAKHWPGVPIYHDVRDLTADALRRDGIAVDVICGGFPCQDISVAGKGAGIAGERSGLWREYARLVGELRPRFVIVENVAALLNRGFGDVLGNLAALRYDAEWHCIPASAVGAPHRRDRVWVIAYPDGAGLRQQPVCELRRDLAAVVVEHGKAKPVADANSSGRPTRQRNVETKGYRHSVAAGGSDVVMADSEHSRREGRDASWKRAGPDLPSSWWAIEPDVGRVAHGVPARVDRLRGLGNAVVPQIPELIGRAIIVAHTVRRAA